MNGAYAPPLTAPPAAALDAPAALLPDEEPPQAARAPASPAAPITLRNVLREIFFMVVIPPVCSFLPGRLSAAPSVGSILPRFFKNRMENAGLSFGKNRHSSCVLFEFVPVIGGGHAADFTEHLAEILPVQR